MGRRLIDMCRSQMLYGRYCDGQVISLPLDGWSSVFLGRLLSQPGRHHFMF